MVGVKTGKGPSLPLADLMGLVHLNVTIAEGKCCLGKGK